MKYDVGHLVGVVAINVGNGEIHYIDTNSIEFVSVKYNNHTGRVALDIATHRDHHVYVFKDDYINHILKQIGLPPYTIPTGGED